MELTVEEPLSSCCAVGGSGSANPTQNLCASYGCSKVPSCSNKQTDTDCVGDLSPCTNTIVDQEISNAEDGILVLFENGSREVNHPESFSQLKLFVINHLTKCKVEKEKLYKQNSVLQQERSKLLKENTKLQIEKGALQAENELLNQQLQQLTEQSIHISQELKSLQLDGVGKSRMRSRRHGKSASQDHIIVKLEDGALENLQPASDDSNLTEQIEEMSQLWNYIESYNSTLAKVGQHVSTICVPDTLDQNGIIMKRLSENNSSLAVDMESLDELEQTTKMAELNSGPPCYCEQCGVQFPSVGSFDQHMKENHGDLDDESRFRCIHCEFNSSEMADFKAHVTTQHRDDPARICSECRESFSNVNPFIKHLGINSGSKEFNCTQCSARFVNSCQLKIHLKLHSGVRPFTCYQCLKKFRSTYHLYRHLQERHEELKATAVTRRKKASVDTESTTSHHSCTLCSKPFPTLQGLNRHLHEFHATFQNSCFRCVQCDFSCTDVADFQSHLSEHSNDSSTKICSECHETFVSIQPFVRHLGVNTGTKDYNCRQCTEQFVNSCQLKIHQKLHSGSRPFLCHLCLKKFRSTYHLYRHHQEIHEGLKICARVRKRSGVVATSQTTTEYCCCTLCGQQFTTSKSLQRHLQVAHTSPGVIDPFMCAQCRFSSANVSELITHTSEQHTGDSTKMCSECYQTFTSMGLFVKHVGMSDGEKFYYCPDCSDSFANACLLKVHLKLHSGSRPFVCVHCYKRFRSSYHLVRHLQARHKLTNNHEDQTDHQMSSGGGSRSDRRIQMLQCINANGRYCCNICNKNYSSAQGWNNHMLKHTGNRMHSCLICSRHFYSKADLGSHTRRCHQKTACRCPICDKLLSDFVCYREHMRIHTGEKPFKCNECGKCFAIHKTFQMHVKLHTGEEKCTCPTCGKSFQLKNRLKQHMWVHEGKRFICQYCSRSFTQSGDLRQHVRSKHTHETPHQCNYCGKQFADKNCLKYHIRKHTGERPYVCTDCNEGFLLSSHLKRHMLLHNRHGRVTPRDSETVSSQQQQPQ